MAEDRELRESGLVIVEIIDLPGYAKGVRTSLAARDAEALSKSGQVKVIEVEKRLMNKLAPATNVKAEDGAEGDDESDGADKKGGKSKKGGTK